VGQAGRKCLKILEAIQIVPRLTAVQILLPSLQPSPRGRGSHLEPLCESPLPLEEGQGEGHSCYALSQTLDSETVSERLPHEKHSPKKT